MTVWFTSDPHWGHLFVAKTRGFETTEEHDETLLANYQRVIRRTDQTWWLGDLCMNSPEKALAQIEKIPGDHHLILGNHDKANPLFRDAHKYQRRYLDTFASVQTHARRRINGQEVLLSHFPYIGEGDDHTDIPRYTQYRLPDEGRWLIHGHTHNAEQRVHGHQIHVGVDAWDMLPVSLDYVAAVIPHRQAP